MEMRRKNRHAVALGRRAQGHKKTYSEEEIAKRTARIIEAQKKRVAMMIERKALTTNTETKGIDQ